MGNGTLSPSRLAAYRAEKDMVPWANERLEALLVGIEAKGVPNKGWVRVTKFESCTGDASVSNRKGKRIVAYELNIKCKWEGQVDYDDVSGELLLPYISEDVSDSNYEIKLTATDSKDARCAHSTRMQGCILRFSLQCHLLAATRLRSS